jgi:hypothetical protein
MPRVTYTLTFASHHLSQIRGQRRCGNERQSGDQWRNAWSRGKKLLPINQHGEGDGPDSKIAMSGALL